MSPVTFGLVLSIPLSLLLSSAAAGRAASRLRLFLTPQELTPPVLVRPLAKNLAAVRRREPLPAWLQPHNGVVLAVVDPYIHAVHVTLLRQKRRIERKATEYHERLAQRLLEKGVPALNRREQMALLMNPAALSRLHQRVWRTPAAQLSPWWKQALRHYNRLASKPVMPLYR